MPTTEQQEREEDLRRLLTDAIEVQLAALKAGISFWTEWIEQTSEFVQSATKTLTSINSEGQKTNDSILELIDAGRASLRNMTEIPRNTANKFIEELDKLAKETEPAKPKPATPSAVVAKQRIARTRPKRSGRAKA
jgi:Fic family protein